MRILVTGANGFIGSALIKHLSSLSDFTVTGLVRSKKRLPNIFDIKFINYDLESLSDHSVLFHGFDVIIHCAGYAHMSKPHNENSDQKFHKLNTQSTINIGKLAARAGVKRFIFLSSIKVNGESTERGKPFTKFDRESPQDAYSMSKYKAEVGLKQIACESSLEVTIVRIPLVYGPNMKGNLAQLLWLIERRIPLPLALTTDNLRSLIGIDNLISFLTLCIKHPSAANETFLVSDDQDLSTYDILQLLGVASGNSTKLYKIPVKLLRLLAITVKLRLKLHRLLGDLQIDNSHVFTTTNWRPPHSVLEGFKKIKIIDNKNMR